MVMIFPKWKYDSYFQGIVKLSWGCLKFTLTVYFREQSVSAADCDKLAHAQTGGVY